MLALQENNQIYLSEIVAYKKQLDSCKKELEEERSRGQQLEAEVHVHVLYALAIGYTWYIKHRMI